jgi:hypothetical protein
MCHPVVPHTTQAGASDALAFHPAAALCAAHCASVWLLVAGRGRPHVLSNMDRLPWLDHHMFFPWHELCHIAESISFTDEEDAIIWSFSSNGIYLVQTLYAVVSFNGVKPVHCPAVWGLKIPPRVLVFLWLLSNNKLVTRDNLGKRREVEGKTCLFCNEPESVNHIFCEQRHAHNTLSA